MLFNDRTVSGDNVKENLLRLKVPDPDEEQDELWAASTDLVDFKTNTKMKRQIVCPFPNLNNTRIGFYILIKWI